MSFVLRGDILFADVMLIVEWQKPNGDVSFERVKIERKKNAYD